MMEGDVGATAAREQDDADLAWLRPVSRSPPRFRRWIHPLRRIRARGRTWSPKRGPRWRALLSMNLPRHDSVLFLLAAPRFRSWNGSIAASTTGRPTGPSWTKCSGAPFLPFASARRRGPCPVRLRPLLPFPAAVLRHLLFRRPPRMRKPLLRWSSRLKLLLQLMLLGTRVKLDYLPNEMLLFTLLWLLLVSLVSGDSLCHLM